MINIIPQSEVRLLKTPLEKDSEHTLNFSTINDQTAYFLTKVIKSYTDFTYIREQQAIVVPENYDQIYTCNYLMYKNNGFNNKYFYAFITKMEYVSENSTRIYFEIDSFQTWYFQINMNQVFIEREHVSDDTIGLHTVPETLEHGEYVQATNYTRTNFIGNPCICIEATRLIGLGNISGGSIQNKIFSGTIKYLFKDDQTSYAWGTANEFLKQFDSEGYGESITGIYMIPAKYTNYATWHEIRTGSGLYYGRLNSDHNNIPFDFGDFTATTPSTLAGNYTPVNNKLYCFPYRYCLISNSAGTEVPMHYENFENNSPVFQIQGAITPGCSIKMTPLNYKGVSYNFDESIDSGKLPICSWSSDMYTNWLTQTSVNRTLTEVGGIIKAVAGGAQIIAGDTTGGLSNIGSGIGDIKNNLLEKYEHSFMPSQAKGNVNSGDINFSTGNTDFIFYHYSIKPEYSRIIDEFFTKYGYQVNRLKTPEINSRRNFNYIKTIDCNFTGDIPQEDLQKIKDIFNKGVTIWHNAENFLNYSVNNDII